MGYCFSLRSGAISWASRKQKIVTTSSTEAEYISLSCGVQQALWIRNWLDKVELGLGAKPLDIFCDNLGAISVSETNRAHNLTKHLDLKYLFTRDIVAEGKVAIHPVKSSQNIADIMTKSLAKDKHRRIVTALGLDWKSQATRGSVNE